MPIDERMVEAAARAIDRGRILTPTDLYQTAHAALEATEQTAWQLSEAADAIETLQEQNSRILEAFARDVSVIEARDIEIKRLRNEITHLRLMVDDQTEEFLRAAAERMAKAIDVVACGPITEEQWFELMASAAAFREMGE